MTTSQKDQAMFHIKRQRKRKPRHAPYTQSGKPTVVKEYDNRCVLVCSRSAWPRCRGQLQVSCHWWAAAWFAFRWGLRCPTRCVGPSRVPSARV